MARKPNYKFERMERDRTKAAKKAARLKAKQDKSAPENSENADHPETDEREPADED